MDLKELFGEEIATKISDITKEKGLSFIVDNKEKPEFIPKDRFNEVIGSKNELKSQVSELTNQLENLKKSAKGNEELTKAIEELQNRNVEWEGKYKRSMLENAIKLKALQEKAKDASDLMKFMDLNALEITEDGSIKGIDEQMSKLKESKGYLFDIETQKPTGQAMNPPAGNAGSVMDDKEKYYELLREASNNPNNKTIMHQLFIQKAKLKG